MTTQSEATTHKPKQDDGSKNLEPLANVTKENYETAARMWIAANGGAGFMIARRESITPRGEKIRATKIEYGAWRSYFERLGLMLNVASMERRGFYMVPTQWPEQFDSAWTAAQSQHAGGQFFDQML